MPHGAVLLALLTLAACQRQNEVELTLVARQLALETQIADVRASATIDAARLQTTLESMGTRLARARGQHRQLGATLEARATSPASPLPARGQPGRPPFPLPTSPQDANPPPTGGAAAALLEAVLARGVGADDCASERTREFASDVERIYIVARAWNIPAGATIAARFSIGGAERRFELRRAYPIHDNCVWFFVDRSDMNFIPGTGSAQLELEGLPAGTPLEFRILDAVP